MMKPTVHLNGTSVGKLIEMYQSAIADVDVALMRVAEACPNGRDYYPQGPGALEVAHREHNARLEKLRAVRNELLEIYEHLLDENDVLEIQKRGR